MRRSGVNINQIVGSRFGTVRHFRKGEKVKIEITDLTDRGLAIIALPFFVAVVLVALIVFFYISGRPVG